MSLLVALPLLCALTACSARRRAPPGAGLPVASAPARASASASASAAAGAEAAPPSANGVTCGKADCRIYASGREAFAAVLATHPAVLAVGEAHALRGTEAAVSTTRRFTDELLPMLAGRASDLVVEILVPNAACTAATKQAAQEQKVVTEHQSATDQNDFVTLARAASRLGIRPHALLPTCDDLSRIAGAGPDAVLVSLDVVTRLSRDTLIARLDANIAAKDARMVAAYGGMMHNDREPRRERARWSYGPLLASRLGSRYVELDLVVPELVDATATWASLPWFAAFDPGAHPAEARLLAPAEGSFVLVFAGNGWR